MGGGGGGVVWWREERVPPQMKEKSESGARGRGRRSGREASGGGEKGLLLRPGCSLSGDGVGMGGWWSGEARTDRI